MDNILNLVPNISPSRKYWFVRTEGGTRYKEFIEGEYIGLSWDKITLIDTQKTQRDLKIIVKEKYPKMRASTHTANQIIRFCNYIKKGDIVLIPSKDSAVIMFGEVLEDKIYFVSNEGNTKVEKGNSKKSLPLEKRKKVKWITNIKRNRLDPNLYKLIYSHHTITDAKPYEQYIDKALYSFFIKGDIAHLVLNVQTTKGINAKDLFKMGLNILELLDDFSNISGYKVDSDNIETKIFLQSKGKVEFVGKVSGLLALGLLIVGINGGVFKSNNSKIPIDIHTDGLIKSIVYYQNNSQERETKEAILKKYMDEFEVQQPEELIKLLDALKQDSERDTVKDDTTNDKSSSSNKKLKKTNSTSMKDELNKGSKTKMLPKHTSEKSEPLKGKKHINQNDK